MKQRCTVKPEAETSCIEATHLCCAITNLRGHPILYIMQRARLEASWNKKSRHGLSFMQNTAVRAVCGEDDATSYLYIKNRSCSPPIW